MRRHHADITPFRYVTTVLRRRWKLVAGAALLGAVAGVGIAVILPPSYTAKSQIVIDAQAATIGNLIDEAAVDTRVEMLMSAGHLRRVVESLPQSTAEPGSDAAAALSMTDRAELAYARLIARIMPVVAEAEGGMVKPLHPEVDLAGLQVEDLERSMNVYKERRSRVIAVTYRSFDPVAAATMARRAVEVYVNDLRSQREKSRADSLRRLDERIPQAKATMEAAEGRLRRFATAHGFLENGEVGDEDVRIAEIIRQLATARSELAERRRRLETSASGGDGEAERSSLGAERANSAPASGTTLVASRAGVPQSEADATPAAIGASIGSDATKDTLAFDTSVIEARVSYLERWQSRLQDARAQSLDAELAYRELVRMAASSLQVYDALLRRQSDLLAQESVQPDARILSLAAVPDKPSSPDTILFILPAMIFAVLSGALLALLLERGNRTVRSARLLEDDEQLSDVVLLPHIGRSTKKGEAVAMAAGPFSAFADALRLVSVMSTKAMRGSNGASSVCLVTSSGPREGKSTLAISLAAYLQTLGRKVLLVDMDFRHPGLSSEFEAAESNGIFDLLQGSPSHQRIKRNQALGIDYLPLPQEPVDPLRLFTHQALGQVMQDLRRQYDVIVIDGSYVTGTADAEFLSRMVDRVILVARWGHTTIEAAQMALARLRDLQSSTAHPEQIGAVLTMVRMTRYRRHRFAEVG